MADTSGPGSYTTPPNANFKGQIHTPSRSHSSLRGAVCIPQETSSPSGDAIRKLSVLTPRKPPRACSPSARTALTGVTEPFTRNPLRPRSGRAASVPARPPGTCLEALPVTARGTPPLSAPPPSGPPTRPRAGLPTYSAHLHRPPAGSGLTPAPPGTQVRGRRRRTAARLFQPDPEGSASVLFWGPSESPDSRSPTKPARSPTPYLNWSKQRGSHACHMSANNNKLSSTSPPRAPVRSPRPGLGRRPTLEGSKGVPEGSGPG